MIAPGQSKDPARGNLEELLAEYEQAAVFRDPVSCRAIMIALVGLLALTPAERSWLDTAGKFLGGSVTQEELEHARVDAWESLGDRSCQFTGPAVNRTRAVICTLFPTTAAGEELEDFANVSEFFLAAGGSMESLHRLIASTRPDAR